MCGGETLVLDDLISRNVVIYLGAAHGCVEVFVLGLL